MSSPRTLKSALAACLAVGVMLLGLAAVSPRVHAQLCAQIRAEIDHAHDHAHDGHAHGAHTHDESSGNAGSDEGHSCAVTLFAAGTEIPVSVYICAPVALHADGVASFTALLLTRTLRGPERVCGPPALA